MFKVHWVCDLKELKAQLVVATEEGYCGDITAAKLFVGNLFVGDIVLTVDGHVLETDYTGELVFGGRVRFDNDTPAGLAAGMVAVLVERLAFMGIDLNDIEIGDPPPNLDGDDEALGGKWGPALP